MIFLNFLLNLIESYSRLIGFIEVGLRFIVKAEESIYKKDILWQN